MILQPLGFTPSFVCETVDYDPNGKASIEFRAVGASAGIYGPHVRVRTRAGDEWLGQFFAGAGRLTALFCGPSAEHLCVVAGGLGYLLEVTKPANFEVIAARPIVEVRRVPDTSILIFLNHTSIVAYAPDGLIWTVRDLADDGIKIEDITAKRLTVRISGDEFSLDRTCVIDVRSGAIISGRSSTSTRYIG